MIKAPEYFPAHASRPFVGAHGSGAVFSAVFPRNMECGLQLIRVSDGETLYIPFTEEYRAGRICSVMVTPFDAAEWLYRYRCGDLWIPDPHAFAVCRTVVLEEGEQKEVTACSCQPLRAHDLLEDGPEKPLPPADWSSQVVYGLHVRGFTAACSDLEESLRGTFVGVSARIPYLKDLGITAVEIMPVYTPIPDRGRKKTFRTMQEALGAWPVTVLAIGIYVISISVDLYRYSEGLDELPLQEQAYLAYYKEKGISFDGKEFICKMEVPTGLDAVKNSDTPKIIKNNVNHTGLNDNNISDWESMLSAIMKNSEQYPTKTKEYLDDLYYKYADAYWQLPEDVRNGWFTQWMMKQGYDDEFIDTMLKQKILKSDIDAWRKDKIDQTLLNFQDQLKNQIDKYATKSYTDFKKAVQKEIINPLNQMIYFLIDDTSLTKEQTFYDSLYCQDYRLIPFNQEAYFKNISFKMDKHPLDSYPLMKKELPIYSDVVTTMRYADVEYPVFYPYQIVVDGGLPYIEKVELTDRYPHTPEYLPFVDMTGYKGYKNMVFVTTLYHYIQMGRPTRMIFRDVNGINTFEDAQKYYDDPGIEASFSIPKFNKNGHSFVKVKVGGDGDLSNLNGYWEGPWLGSSKQWYYFDIESHIRSGSTNMTPRPGR